MSGNFEHNIPNRIEYVMEVKNKTEKLSIHLINEISGLFEEIRTEEEEIKKIDKRIEERQKRIDEIDKRTNERQKRIEEIDKRMKKRQKKIDKIEKEIAMEKALEKNKAIKRSMVIDIENNNQKKFK